MMNPEMEYAWIFARMQRNAFLCECSPTDAPEVVLIQNSFGESLHVRKVIGEWWLAGGWLDGIIPPLDRGP